MFTDLAAIQGLSAHFPRYYEATAQNDSPARDCETVIDYGVDGVPTLAIGGRCKVSEDHTKMLAVTDELIAKARAEEKKPRK
jgi:predicted DsbA family dithiol-disulfide isomerase